MSDFDLAKIVHGRIRRLHHIQRYSSMPVVKYESVATHSWQMAMIGLLIAYDLNLNDGPHMVNTGEVVARCVLHDISEAISGDVIRSYKHGTPEMEAACREADSQNTYRLTRDFGKEVGDEIYLRWESAKNATLAGDIVRLADAVCVVTYCAEEFHLGNRLLDHVLKGIFEEILWRMREHKQLGKYIHQLFPTGEYTDAYNIDAEWVVTWAPSREGSDDGD